MPIYGYVCQRCEHTLDVLQKISDDPLVDCPGCGEPQLKRQLSAPRFRLKGSGWYETDFKKGNQRNLHGEKDSGKKGDAEKDGKPAAETSDSSGSKSAVDGKTGADSKSAVTSKTGVDSKTGVG